MQKYREIEKENLKDLQLPNQQQEQCLDLGARLINKCGNVGE
jgi:hypothetical protein